MYLKCKSGCKARPVLKYRLSKLSLALIAALQLESAQGIEAKVDSNSVELKKLIDSVRETKNPEAAKDAATHAMENLSDGTFEGHQPLQLLNALRKNHPRLMITNQDLDTVRDTIKMDITPKHLYEVLMKRAEEMLLEEPQYRTDPEGALTEARLVLKHLTTFAGLYRLNHDARLLNKAREEMLKVAAFPDWGPANFLDVAETTAAMGIGYDWLFDKLTVADRETIRTAIVAKGLAPGLEQYHGQGWWRLANSNWNFVCNGGMTVGALAIAEDEPVLAQKILACATVSTPLALKSLESDGGWPEGPMYWTYGTRYLTYFLSSLESALNTNFDFLNTPGLSETGLFRIHTQSPIGICFNFADSETEVGRGAQMFWLSKKFHRPVFAGDELHIAEIFPEMFHLLFYTREHVTPAQANLPLNHLFKGVNVACLRSSWTDPNAAFVGFKGGNNTSHHAHLDLGSFVFDIDGLRWAEDLGPENYDVPGYFSKERWNYYRTRTEGHNTLTSNSSNQNQSAKSTIVAFSPNVNSPFAIADLSDAYKDCFTSVKRGIRLIAKDSLLVQDEIQAPNTAPLEWHLHTLAKVEISGDGRKAFLQQNGKNGLRTMVTEILSPPNATFKMQMVDFAPPLIKQSGVCDLSIPLTLNPGDSTIVVRICRLDAAEKSGNADSISIQKLSDWE